MATLKTSPIDPDWKQNHGSGSFHSVVCKEADVFQKRMDSSQRNIPADDDELNRGVGISRAVLATPESLVGYALSLSV